MFKKKVDPFLDDSLCALNDSTRKILHSTVTLSIETTRRTLLDSREIKLTRDLYHDFLDCQ